MPEILSQQEIDSLLSGIATAEEPKPSGPAQDKQTDKEVVTFDFRLPHRLSKNQLRTFQAVHEGFGESFGSYLVSRLQTTVSVNVISVDQLFYSEYVLSIASPSCLNVFRIVESDAVAILELSPQLVLAMVARLLGGTLEGEKKARLITQIEQSIIRGILQRALSDLQRAWKTIADLSFKLERYESEGDFAQIAPTSEIVLVVSLEVTIGDHKYLMNLCFPTFALDEILARMNVQHISGMPSVTPHNEWTGIIQQKLESTAVSAICMLGETKLTLHELVDLEPGDVLRTNIPLTGELQLRIGGKTRVWGRPGIFNNRVALKVTRVASESENGE
jgi:flagellar motor switch protein FliM